MLAPIEEHFNASDFPSLTTGDGAAVLEGVALLQWLRSAVLGAVLLGLVAIATQLFAAPSWLWVVTTCLILVLPAYMLLLGLVRLWVLRQDGTGTLIADCRGPLIATRFGPVAAIIVGVALGLGLGLWLA